MLDFNGGYGYKKFTDMTVEAYKKWKDLFERDQSRQQECGENFAKNREEQQKAKDWLEAELKKPVNLKPGEFKFLNVTRSEVKKIEESREAKFQNQPLELNHLGVIDVTIETTTDDGRSHII